MHKYKKEHEYHEQTTTALPYDIMKTLQDNPGVTLIFSYTLMLFCPYRNQL